MTVFLALFFTSSNEIPTLSYTSSLKKVPLLGRGRASPYSPFLGVPSPRTSDTCFAVALLILGPGGLPFKRDGVLFEYFEWNWY